MLAINHTTLATAGALGASIYFNEPFFLPFIAFVVFASLLPDIDHSGSEISNYFPIVNKALPHRGITHSIVGTALFSLGLYFLLGYNLILTFILLIFGFIGVRFLYQLLLHRVKQIQKLSQNFFSRQQIRLMIGTFITILNIFLISLAFLAWKPEFRQEILILLIFGYTAHLLGDFVTKEGIPIFWPIKKKIGLKLFRTGSIVETLVGFMLFIVNVYLLWIFWGKFGLSSTSYWNNYFSFQEIKSFIPNLL